MKLQITKSTTSGDGYLSTLTDSGESLVCKPFSGGAWYDDIVKSYKENPKIKVESVESEQGYEQTYMITDAQEG